MYFLSFISVLCFTLFMIKELQLIENINSVLSIGFLVFWIGLLLVIFIAFILHTCFGINLFSLKNNNSVLPKI